MKTKLSLGFKTSSLKLLKPTILAVLFTLFTTTGFAQANGGTISTTDDTTICVDGIADPINVQVTGASGNSFYWVITDVNNTILALPENPPFDFDQVGPGVCRIWYVASNFRLRLRAGRQLQTNVPYYSVSNYIEVVRNQPEGGALTGGPFSFTVGDGVADNIPDGAITLSDNTGENSQWVVTDSDGNILGLPPSPYVVDFDGAGTGTCLVWNLSFYGDIQGAMMGNNAADLVGCYSLSNPIEVIRNSIPVGGTLAGGPFEYCVGDGEADNIPDGAITLTDNAGENSQWVITDGDGTILGLPPSPYVVNFDGAGSGTCLVWHLSFNGDIQGAAMGNNAADLVGDYSLSNPIPVVRNQPEGGLLEGGPFTFTVGDGIADNIPDGAITLSGESGSNSQWVVTDSDGNILGLPPSPYVVNFDGAGVGTCLVWHLSFDGDLQGAMMGSNAADLVGCYNLSNPIEVNRTDATVAGGTLEGGPFEYCVGDGEADNIPEGAITLTGNLGENSQWVVTDSDGNILGLPPTPYVVNFDGAGVGTCLVWHLSFNGDIQGAMMGNNAADLVGDYSLSNPISVYRNQPEGGLLEGGPFSYTVGDGIADNIPDGAITLSGESGSNSQWVVTDSDGNILGLPPSPYVVDFDGAGEGTCLVWHLSFDGDLQGAAPGNNAADLVGCYSLSNPIEVIRNNQGDCNVSGGQISTDQIYFFCQGDGEPDYATGITLSNNSGVNSQWVVTDIQGNILGLPPTPDAVNFDEAGPGACLIWHLSYDTLGGAEPGNNALTDLTGCYSLSNPITVIRFEAGSFFCNLNSALRQDQQTEIKLYPNPARDNVSLNLDNIEADTITIKIHDFTSNEMYSNEVNSRLLKDQTTSIDVRNLKPGFYIISISNKSGEIIAAKRLIKE